MPRHCSVYGCRSNYDSESDHVSTFSLPKDPELNQRWLRKIPTDLTRSKHPVICIKHFHESLIIRSDIVQYKGEIKEYPRERPKLRNGAVPTIFPNTPSYLSEPVTTVTRLADVEEARLQEAVKNSLADHAAYGISYNDALKIRKDHVSPSLTLYYQKPVMITHGSMQWLWDDQGQRYLDMFGGIVTVSVGHCHPKVTNAAVEQLRKLWHLTNIYLHPTQTEYTQKLTDRLPEGLKVCYFCNSGSEANDLALQMARLYTGAFDIISLRNAYHGDSPYSIGLCGIGKWKHQFANGFGIHYAMNPNPYLGIWGGAHCRDSPVQVDRICRCNTDCCEATENYVGVLEELLKDSLPKKIAGFFAESIQGVGGCVQFPKGYLKKVQSLVHERGGLLIADEVQTGFGRTGKYWGFQGHDIIPDIVTMAKGMGNGFPLAAVVTRPEIAQCLNKALMFNTYGGNPVACAVGSSVLDVIDDEKLMENSQNVGTHLLLSLSKLRKYEIVGDVRGKGLMIGVEFVKNKKSKLPLPATDFLEIFEDTKNMGLLLGKGGAYGNVLRIKPPMCISTVDADFCVNVLEKAIMNFISKRK